METGEKEEKGLQTSEQKLRTASFSICSGDAKTLLHLIPLAWSNNIIDLLVVLFTADAVKGTHRNCSRNIKFSSIPDQQHKRVKKARKMLILHCQGQGILQGENNSIRNF